MMKKENMKNFTDFFLLDAIELALLAGKQILRIYNETFEVSYKQDNSPLTAADTTAHEIILNGLIKTAIPVLSEEGKKISYSERKNWKKLWIVDPLDGTKEFVKKNDEFTVNIALVENGKPTLGVVFCPPLNILYFGSEKLGGAYRAIFEDEVIRMGQEYINVAEKLPVVSDHRGITIVASRSHQNKETIAFIDQIKNIYQDVVLKSKGSSLKLCLIAEGTADVYPRFAPTSEWDTAAAHAILSIAGGYVVDANTETDLLYNKENILNPWFIAGRDKKFVKTSFHKHEA